mgnify:CR=1 FL=1
MRRVHALRASITRAFDRATTLALLSAASLTAGTALMFGTGAGLIVFGVLAGATAVLLSGVRGRR